MRVVVLVGAEEEEDEEEEAEGRFVIPDCLC